MTPRSLIAPARLAGGALLRSQSDERLVDLTRAGNVRAFEAIVDRYRGPLLHYCARIVPGGRAEDAVQQTFLRAHDALRASDAEIQLRPWLYRIAHNTALNALRDRSLDHAELDDTVDGVERPDQAFDRRERLRSVVTSVKGLPARQRDAMVLRELEGRSYEEIAATLGVTDGSVRMLLNRARTTVRAGVSAVTPYGLLLRLPLENGDDAAGRVGDIATGTGGALVAKAAVTVLVTGAVVGGGVAVEHHGGGQFDGPAPAQASAAPGPARDTVPAARRPPLSGTAKTRSGIGGEHSRPRAERRGPTRRALSEKRADRRPAGGRNEGGEEDHRGPGPERESSNDDRPDREHSGEQRESGSGGERDRPEQPEEAVTEREPAGPVEDSPEVEADRSHDALERSGSGSGESPAAAD